MRIGLLSDVHANLPALEAVLRDMPPVDTIVCAGDVVGYNPMPEACVERIREVASTTVQGNHDRTVETPVRYAGNHMAHAGLELALEELSEGQLDWLRELPESTTIGDGEFLLVHSRPEHRGEYVYPDQFADLRAFLDEYDGVVLGHTHVQGKAHVDGRLVVNPGSVGQPRDDDSRAAYAVLDTDESDAELRRVHYDIDRVHHEIAVEGLPTESGDRLFVGE